MASKHPRPGRIGSTIVVLALVAFVAVGAGMYAPMLRSPEQVAADAAPPAPKPVTIPIENRLVQERIEIPLTVLKSKRNGVKASPESLAAGLVVTATPLSKGDFLASGRVLLEANGEPLIGFDWDFPPYRDLTSGIQGPHVKQLQVSLGNAGYSVKTSGVLDRSTEKAFTAFLRYRGYRPFSTKPVLSDTLKIDTESKSETLSKNADLAQDSEPGRVILPARNVVRIPSGEPAIDEYTVKVGDRLQPDSETLIYLKGYAPQIRGLLNGGQASILGDETVLDLSEIGVDREDFPKLRSVSEEVTELEGLGSGLVAEFRAGFTLVKAIQESSLATGFLIPAKENEPSPAVPNTALHDNADGSTFIMLLDPVTGTISNVPVDPGASGQGWVSLNPSSEVSEGNLVVIEKPLPNE